MNNVHINRRVETLCSDAQFLIKLRNNKFKTFDYSPEMVEVAYLS